jgi:hypothetical protein
MTPVLSVPASWTSWSSSLGAEIASVIFDSKFYPGVKRPRSQRLQHLQQLGDARLDASRSGAVGQGADSAIDRRRSEVGGDPHAEREEGFSVAMFFGKDGRALRNAADADMDAEAPRFRGFPQGTQVRGFQALKGLQRVEQDCIESLLGGVVDQLAGLPAHATDRVGVEAEGKFRKSRSRLRGTQSNGGHRRGGGY